MSDQLANLLHGTGHASQGIGIVGNPSKQDHREAPGFLVEFETKANRLCAQFEEDVERYTEDAVYSDGGKVYLCQYGFLMDEQSGYPYRFHSHDIVLAAPWILAQLVAEEYFEDGPDACPYTPGHFIGFDFSGDGWKKRGPLDDPFKQEVDKRPDVTVEMNGKEIFNDNPKRTIRIRPAEGFIEYGP